jgi:uncharacterized RDD family membrane protein YckC
MATTHGAIDARGAFDPIERPELYDGVRTRRATAFLIDVTIVVALTTLAYLAVLALGVPTLGLGWLLLPLVWPLVPILYNTLTLGGPNSATPGMRVMGVEMRTFDGGRMYPLLALLHGVLFWLSVTFLTPLVLVVALFTPRKQLLHDLLLGTVVIRDRA